MSLLVNNCNVTNNQNTINTNAKSENIETSFSELVSKEKEIDKKEVVVEEEKEIEYYNYVYDNLKSEEFGGMGFIEYITKYIADNNMKPGDTVLIPSNERTIHSSGNASGLSYRLEYAEHSTDENPVMLAQGIDEYGVPFEEYIYINEIDPTHANIIELQALTRYIDGSVLGEAVHPNFIATGKHEYFDYTKSIKKEINNQAMLGQFDVVKKLEKILEKMLELIENEKTELYTKAETFQTNLQGELESQLLLMQCK